MTSCHFASVLTLSAKLFPFSTPALTTPFLLGSPAPVPDDQDFDVLCFMLQFSSHCVEGSNSKQHRLCFMFHMFSQESKLFGIQSSRWMWKEGGCVSSSQSLILTAEAKNGYIYADQNRFLKYSPAAFEQSAHNCSCCTGDSTSKSWIEFEIWFILIVGQLPVFPLGWSCVNPALIFSEKSTYIYCRFFSRQLILILFRFKIYIRKELIRKESVLVFSHLYVVSSCFCLDDHTFLSSIVLYILFETSLFSCLPKSAHNG